MESINERLETLSSSLKGELRRDNISRLIYATDASVYREVPVAVVYPCNDSDLKEIVEFAGREKIPLTMRAGGTSLAGQATGGGIIVDISRHMNRIIEINRDERWVKVQPGVVLDELNMELRKHGLFFGPETSTANRCNIGGMVGNNACGLHSLVYGSTRDHLIELKVILSDGSEAVFGATDRALFNEKCTMKSLEGNIYRKLRDLLSDPSNARSIRDEFPHPDVHRRNTGYAVDLLLDSNIFDETSQRRFNLTDIVAGSEGTLAIVTEAKLNLIPLPSVNKALVCVHLNHRNEAFRANLIALKYSPSAVELMDDRILGLTKGNITQLRNRFFVEGEPGGILIVEFLNDSSEDADRSISLMIDDLKRNGFGYSFPVIKGKEISKVWELRKAGLGVLSNMKGDAKPVTLIEDTAVNVAVLPEYMEELENMLRSYGKDAVYHAHIGTGELHIRPVLNLKDPDDLKLFRTIGFETAKLVKKYRGSISGEHGDGRLRGEFIPLVIGEKNYNILKEIKKCWDPDNILNPGKITDTLPMNSGLRYDPGQFTPQLNTFFDFTSTAGVIRAAENCNGSGDCRKSEIIGGLMCPSFMATRDEKNTTRARANILREFLSRSGGDPWDHREIYEILDLCLSCKGCKSECPSNVDIAKLKAEFLQHWYDKHGVPLRSRVIAWITSYNRIGSLFPAVYNFFITNRILSGILKRVLGFAGERTIPILYGTTLRKWIRRNPGYLNPVSPKGRVCLFIDEFTNYNDTGTGIKAVKLLHALNYEIVVHNHKISGRTFLSKGLIRRAASIARKNVITFSEVISSNLPLVGIEPSAILAFRDEYPELVGSDLEKTARKLAEDCLLFDEFIVREYNMGRIGKDSFDRGEKKILVHTHCQQKAIAGSSSLIQALGIPEGFVVKEIPSGCCGMAGSFGYEKEHFELSNKIGELVLFPGVRNAGSDTVIVAPGTSCRHHIKDGTGRISIHPAEVLYDAVKK
jgi:FAD/FMN-containing dehydrogenase/Fe-S oxidoreductase